MDAWQHNHPSFEMGYESKGTPSAELLQEHIDDGFAELFETVAQAEQYIGHELHPAPLGLISKVKDDGSVKHRLVQDQRRNSVNSICGIPERQVLPRHVDHAKDIALLSRAKTPYEKAFTLILDFQTPL